VIEPGDNRLHCLQSIELTSSAQLEAFGHFISSRVWNKAPIDAGYTGSCNFGYYKQVSATDLVSAVSLPPVSIDCATPKKHRKVKCSTVNATLDGAPTELGSEVDWLTFLRALTSDAAQPVTVTDVLSWYKTACAGGCTGKRLNFSELRAGVPASKLSQFDSVAAAHGVD
jgi:hypothetical protein